MTREILGDACAYIPGKNGEKNRYPRIGIAMKDDEGRISIKIDTLPLRDSGWEGWVNIFPNKSSEKKASRRQKSGTGGRSKGPAAVADMDDDIPF